MGWSIKSFNELSLEELYYILKERNEVFVTEQNSINNDCDNKDIQSFHLFRLEEDEIVSYLRITPPEVSYPEASIERVLVNAKYRGCGLGREMLKEAIGFVKDILGENQIKVSVRDSLTSLYKSLGFKSVSDHYFEGGIPHVEMEYHLEEQ